ncbi:hypothetical protein DTQ70_04345 [Runella sp. SP2]|nr:hypothetical protein DTQ70_04345 [Runella sp. SP2]
MNSWLFSDDDSLLGSFTYDFRFPLSPKNIDFLEYRHLPEQPYREIEVYVELSNALVMKCNLAYEIEGESGIGFIKFESATVNSKIKNVKLAEVINEVVYLGKTPAQAAEIMEEIARAAVGHYPIVFAPIYNPEFVETDYTLTHEDIEGIAPMTFINYVRNDTINPWGKRKDGTRGFLFNTYEPLLRNLGSVFVNVSAIHAGILNVPYVYMCYVVAKVMDYLGFGIESSWFYEAETQCRVIYNTQALTSFSEITQSLPVITVKVSEHVPDMTIAEFLKAVRKNYSLSIDFDAVRGAVSIKTFAEIERSRDYNDWRTYQTQDPVKISRPNGKGWKVKFEEDGGDVLYKELSITTEFQVGDGDQTYSIGVGTLPMLRQKNEMTGAIWVLPQAKQPGNLRGKFFQKSDRYSDSKPKNEFKLRILAYRGMQPDLEGNLYPMLTSELYNAKGEKIGTVGDNPTLTNSCYAVYVRPYLYFRDQAREVETNLLLPITALQEQKMYKKVGFAGDNRVMMRHILKKLVVELPSDGGFVKAKAYSYGILPIEIGVVSNGAVWLSIEFVNHRDLSENAVYQAIADVVVKAWSDETKQRAITVANLMVLFALQNVLTKEQIPYSASITGSEQIVMTDAIVILTPLYAYQQNVTIAYTPVLIPSSTYSIVPS